MSAFTLIPTSWGAAINAGTIHDVMPGWLYMFCIVVGMLGPVVTGVGSTRARHK